MQTPEAGQRERYQDAIEAVATNAVMEVLRRGVAEDDFMDEVLATIVRFEQEAASEHAWIFRDPAVLHVSDHVFEALEERPGARRDWLHADLGSAVAAVARFDVMSEVVARGVDEAADDEDVDVDEEPAGVGRA
jgi:hypothetical protein